MQNQGPPPRVPVLPVAQLLQKLPAAPDPSKNAYNASTEEKGGLPMEICAFAQSMYTLPQAAGGKGNPSMALEPGWGGRGR